jgi:hypothetical protein
MQMNTNEIVQQLRAERDKLDAAIRALEGIVSPSGGTSAKRRPPGTANKSTPASGRRGVMSTASRKRIAAAMKARWAAAKKSGQKKL